MSIVDTPEFIPKEKISANGSDVEILDGILKENVQTSMGVTKLALFVNVKIPGDDDPYSHMFGLDKEPIAGSAGRVLSKAGFKKVSEITDKTLSKLKGLKFTVKNKGGKLYWY